MIHKATPYILVKDGKYYVFPSEKSACAFLSIIKGISEQQIYNDKRLRKIWASMHERCEYKKHMHYATYGGNGITVCPEWKEYLPFAKWAFSNGYEDNLTLDRVDNNKGYSPENCRWVSYKVQANNKSSNVRIEYRGVTKTIAEWADAIGMNYTTLKERLRSGWSVEKAIETPVRPRTKMEVSEDD